MRAARSLLHFKQGVTSDPFGVLSNWYMSSHFCRWNGVTCTSTRPYRVWGLNLPAQSLSGQISSSLDNLTSLEYLDLSQNNFVGPLPLLGNLIFLEYLDLSQNNFVGPLPLLGRLQHLQYLILPDSNLSGIISDALTNCSNLIYLHLF